MLIAEMVNMVVRKVIENHSLPPVFITIQSN